MIGIFVKKLLVVLKDNVEFKNFVEYFHLVDTSKYEIYLTSPVAQDERFISDIALLNSGIKVIDIWDENYILIADKIKYWLKRQLFYLKKSKISESCFQKFWLHLRVPVSVILTGKVRWPLELLAAALIKIIPGVVYEYVDNLKYESKLPDDCLVETFDRILFMRPDSSINILFYNTFRTSEIEIVTFIRNYDTPALKGVFTINSNVTWVVSNKLKEALVRIHDEKQYGLIEVVNKLQKYKEIQSKSILYCTSHPDFFPSEAVVLKNIISHMASDCVFRIRLHPADRVERYNVSKEYFLDSKEQYVEYKVDGGGVKFHSLGSIEVFKQELASYGILITHSSTVVKDAFDVGIRELYFIVDVNDPYKYIFKREHIEILMEELSIKTLDFQGASVD